MFFEDEVSMLAIVTTIVFADAEVIV